MTVLSSISKFAQVEHPEISTVYAEQGADLVREASIMPGPPPPDPRPKLRAAGRSDEEISKIRQALDALNYGNPKGLILITAWNEAWNERAAGSTANALSAAEARQLPYGVPDGVSRRQMSDALSGPDTAGLTGVLFMYNRFIADITIAMIRVKQASDGAAAATVNPFPVTDHTKREGG